MLFAFFILGLWFGWVVETYREPLARTLSESQKSKFKMLLAAGFFVVAGTFLYSLFAVELGIWDSVAIRVINAVTAPANGWAVIGFIAGWVCYRRREDISASLNSLVVGSSASRRRGQSAEQIKPRTWLMAAGWIPIIAGGLLLVALIALGPDFYSRLESIKLGNVQAQFSTVSQYSVRTTFPEGPGFGRQEDILFASEPEIKKFFKTMLAPVQDAVMPRLALEKQATEKARSKRMRIAKFHEELIFPLADAVDCYLKRFPRGNVVIQGKVAKLSRSWENLSLAVAPLPRQSADQKEAAEQELKYRQLFNRLAEDALALTVLIRRETRGE